ncbi:MAG: glycerophosphodiester phosphodiesterase family protein [Opitutaceae bacterium]
MTRNPLIIAHRGESHDAPENTLASVNLAWERGVPAVEIDVRVTCDRIPVVIHNATTGHMAGRDWTVSRRSFADLRTLDFGRRRGAAWTGQKIPTLEEVLDTVPESGRLFLEIKVGTEAVPPIQKAIRRSRIRNGQVSLIAFRRPVLLAAAVAMPRCDACWIVDLKRRPDQDPAKEASRLARITRADGLAAINAGLDAESDLAIIPALQSHGLKVYAWTINDRFLARRLIRVGIDGITSDRAAWLRQGLRDALNKP